ncbi:hypothetical protein NLJ89_g7766 [Agrocybe chaxingu]|uniref:F-box domain-containing protein n=1 Tax=Agrocybe chaxingu TaxID=84603 RepID=A0A9W8JW62_9AGAR|nr:hypothetical protein NLJ89_g7766 [Agrocybe chaxingu]
MASIQRVSKEVLTQIFHFTLNAEHPRRSSPSDTRRSISAVCIYWRLVINNTPSLWRSITFTPTSSQNAEYRLALARTWLERGRDTPLSLDLCGRTPAQLPTRLEDLLYGGGAFSIVDEAIRPVARRIVSLTCILWKDDIRAFLTLPLGTFPILENISILFLDIVRYPQEEMPSFTVFTDAPRLSSARMHLFSGLHPLDLSLPWSQLTLLDFWNVPMSDETFMRILRSSASTLQDACFQVATFTAYPPLQTSSTFRQVSMQALVKFRLSYNSHITDPAFFKLIDLPVLKYLQIEKAGGFTGIDFETITPLLQSASRSLEQLTLLHLDAETNSAPHRQVFHSEISTLLRVVPQLVYLHLPPGIFLDGPLFEDIALGRILPGLQALEVSTSGLMNCYRVIQMVIIRNQEAGRRLVPPTSSSSQVLDVAFMPISRIRLQVPLAEREGIEEQLMDLVSADCLADVVVELVV